MINKRLLFPPDFTDNIKHGRSASVQVIVDASDSLAASSAISTAQLISQLKSQDIMISKLQNMLERIVVQPYDIRIRPWYNPDFVSAFYMVPGILALCSQ